MKQFKKFVQRCNAVGVRIFVDAIINHMCGEDAKSGQWVGNDFFVLFKWAFL